MLKPGNGSGWDGWSHLNDRQPQGPNQFWGSQRWVHLSRGGDGACLADQGFLGFCCSTSLNSHFRMHEQNQPRQADTSSKLLCTNRSAAIEHETQARGPELLVLFLAL